MSGTRKQTDVRHGTGVSMSISSYVYSPAAALSSAFIFVRTVLLVKRLLPRRVRGAETCGTLDLWLMPCVDTCLPLRRADL
jgi:hypothetical protein